MVPNVHYHHLSTFPNALKVLVWGVLVLHSNTPLPQSLNQGYTGESAKVRLRKMCVGPHS